MASVLTRVARRLLAMPLLLLAASCYDFHLEGPEDPAPVPIPALVSVTIEYTQPNGCISTDAPCDTPVLFLGSWMPTGGHVVLTPDARHHVWTGVATGVPVNYPPTGAPYEVRIFDPFLQDDGRVRYTGRRLKLGGQLLSRIQSPGAHAEAALAYVDSTGQAHNPF